MNPNEEERHLQQMLKFIDADGIGILSSKWLVWAFWLLLCGALFCLFQFQKQLGPDLLVGLSCFTGVITGGCMVWHASAVKWPFVRPHLDRASIARRLSELQS
jgi:hypothetical protein